MTWGVVLRVRSGARDQVVFELLAYCLHLILGSCIQAVDEIFQCREAKWGRVGVNEREEPLESDRAFGDEWNIYQDGQLRSVRHEQGLYLLVSSPGLRDGSPPRANMSLKTGEASTSS